MFVLAVICAFFALKADLVYNIPCLEEATSCVQQSSESSMQSSVSSFASESMNGLGSSFSAASSSFEAASEANFSSVQSGLGSIVESSSSSMQQALSSTSDFRSTVSNGLGLSDTVNLSPDLDVLSNLDVAKSLDLSDNLNLSPNLSSLNDLDVTKSLDLSNNLNLARSLDMSQNLNVANSLDLTSLTSMLQQNSFFSPTDLGYYTSQLQNLEEKKLQYISNMFGMMNGKATCIDQNILVEVQQKMESIYNLMQSNDCFVSGADLSSKTQILNQAKVQLQEIASKLNGNCAACQALKYALEQDNNLLPLVCGLTNGIFKEQMSYYSSSVSSSVC